MRKIVMTPQNNFKLIVKGECDVRWFKMYDIFEKTLIFIGIDCAIYSYRKSIISLI